MNHGGLGKLPSLDFVTRRSDICAIITTACNKFSNINCTVPTLGPRIINAVLPPPWLWLHVLNSITCTGRYFSMILICHRPAQQFRKHAALTESDSKQVRMLLVRHLCKNIYKFKIPLFHWDRKSPISVKLQLTTVAVTNNRKTFSRLSSNTWERCLKDPWSGYVHIYACIPSPPQAFNLCRGSQHSPLWMMFKAFAKITLTKCVCYLFLLKVFVPWSMIYSHNETHKPQISILSTKFISYL